MKEQSQTFFYTVSTGVAAGTADVLVTHPLWTVKTLGQDGNSFKQISSLVKRSPFILYNGVTANSVTMIPLTVIRVSLSATLDEQFSKYNSVSFPYVSFVTSFISGSISSFFGSPTELIRTIKLKNAVYSLNKLNTKLKTTETSFKSIYKFILEKESFAGIFKGAPTVAVRDGIYTAAFFTGAPYLKKMITDEHPDHPVLATLLSYTIASLMASFTNHPFDTIKTVQHSMKAESLLLESKLSGNFLDAVKKIFVEQGMSGFYVGYPARAVRFWLGLIIKASVLSKMEVGQIDKHNSQDNLNLKYVEKGIILSLDFDKRQKIFKLCSLKQEKSNFSMIEKELNFCNNYGTSTFQEHASIMLISDESHIKYHHFNILKLIKMLDYNLIDINTVICLERKQLGANLGMPDVIALAQILEIKSDLYEEIQSLPIFYDSLLYSRAKAKGISVIGIDGKSLECSKTSPLYHRVREEYMAKQLLAIAQSGKNAIFLVGAAHIDNIIKLLGAQNFRVDGNDISSVQNLITLKSNQAVLSSSLVMVNAFSSKTNTELFTITNYENSEESNSQTSEENFQTKIGQPYGLLEYIQSTEQTDLSWQFKKWLYSKEIAKFDQIKQKYNIAISIDELKDIDKFSYSFFIDLENKELERDVLFVAQLKEKLNLPVGTKEIEYLQPIIYKVNMGFKVTDTAVDIMKLLYIPTIGNAQKALMDSAHIYSMYSGVNGLSLIPIGYEAISQYKQIGLDQTIAQVGLQLVTAVSYMLLPTMLNSIGIPCVGFGYITGLTIYTGYNAVLNAYSFYNEFNQKDFKLNSNIAYQNLAEKLSTTSLQNLYDFSSMAKEYEKAIFKLKLAEKGEFGQKLYKYIYSQIIEEKYELLNKIAQGILTKKEESIIKTKQVQLLNYDHCIEFVAHKEDMFEHYYCANETEQIIDQVTIGENNEIWLIKNI